MSSLRIGGGYALKHGKLVDLLLRSGAWLKEGDAKSATRIGRKVTAQVIIVPPFYENFGKRITKSPKLFFADSGLAAHLLGIESEAELLRSPFLGPLFEGLVAAEIVKGQIHSGKAKALYHFRDQQGLEVDFVVPQIETS